MRFRLIPPEVAIAEGRHWRQLRGTIAQLVKAHGTISTAGKRAVISTFDRLPFTWGKIALEPDLLARNEQIGGDDSLCEQLRRAGMSSAEVQDAFGTLMDRARDGVEYIQETSAHAAQHASPIPKIVRSTKDGALRVVWRDSVFPLSVARHTFLSKCHDSICHDSSAATASQVLVVVIPIVWQT